MKWWEVVMYLFATIILIWFVTLTYNKYQATKVANEIEATKKKRMLDLQTLHQLNKMGLT
jgi:hypothetical protein